MDWILFSFGLVGGMLAFALGHWTYACPNRLIWHWHDTNRVHIVFSKIAGGVLMGLGLFTVASVSMSAAGYARSMREMLTPWFGLLGAVLLRPNRNPKPPVEF